MTYTIRSTGARALVWVAGIEFRALESGAHANTWHLLFGGVLAGADSGVTAERDDDSAIERRSATDYDEDVLHARFDLRFGEHNIFQAAAIDIFNNYFRNALGQDPRGSNPYATATLWNSIDAAGAHIRARWDEPAELQDYATYHTQRLAAYQNGGGQKEEGDTGNPQGIAGHGFSGGTEAADYAASASHDASGFIAIDGTPVGSLQYDVQHLKTLVNGASAGVSTLVPIGGTSGPVVLEVTSGYQASNDRVVYGEFTLDTDGDWSFTTEGRSRNDDVVLQFRITVDDQGTGGGDPPYVDITINIHALDVVNAPDPNIGLDLVAEEGGSIAANGVIAINNAAQLDRSFGDGNFGNGRTAVVNSSGWYNVAGDFGTLRLNQNTGIWNYKMDNVNTNNVLRGLDDGEYTVESFTINVSANIGTADAPYIRAATHTLELIIAGKSLDVVNHHTDSNTPLDIVVTEANADGTGGDSSAGGRLREILVHVGSTATFHARTDVAGEAGTFSIDTNGVWTYTLDQDSARLDTLGAGESFIETFMVRVDESFTDGLYPTQQHQVPVEIVVYGADFTLEHSTPGSHTTRTKLYDEEQGTAFAGLLTGQNGVGGVTFTSTGTVVLTNQTSKYYDGTYGFLKLHNGGVYEYIPGSDIPDNERSNWGDAPLASIPVTYTRAGIENERTIRAYAPGAILTDTFTITATDSAGNTATHDVTYQISGFQVAAASVVSGSIADNAPHALEGRISATSGNYGTVSIGSLNDANTRVVPHAEDTLIGYQGTYGFLTLNSDDGTWSYRPNGALQQGGSGTDGFNVTITDTFEQDGES